MRTRRLLEVEFQRLESEADLLIKAEHQHRYIRRESLRNLNSSDLPPDASAPGMIRSSKYSNNLWPFTPVVYKEYRGA